MGGGGKGGSSPQVVPSTQTTSSTPWKPQQEYLKQIFSGAQEAYQDPMTFYQGSTYAPFSPETQAAMDWQTYRATAGSPLTAAAQQQLTDTMAGDYLGAGNPYFSNMMNQVQKGVQPAIDAKFSGSGRYGSGAHEEALASALTDKAGELAYRNYADERENQMKGMMFAPQLAQQDYFDIAKLAEVGGLQEDQSQRAINEAMQRHEYEQMEPWQRLEMFRQMVTGGYGGTTSSFGTSSQIMPTQSLGSGLLGGASALGGLGMLAYTMFSDRKTKENIKLADTKGMLTAIMDLDPVTFDYKPEFGGKNQTGFVANDVEKVYPKAVVMGDDELRRIMPLALIAPLVGAVQEQQRQLDSMKKG